MPPRKELTVSEFARLGGKARAKSLTPEERSAIAKKAAEASAKVRSAKAKRKRKAADK